MNNGSIVINTVYSFQINEIVNKQSNKEKQQEYKKRLCQLNKKREMKKSKIWYQKNKEKMREYAQRPEIKARRKEYMQRPEVKARRRKCDQELYQKNKEKMREYAQRPEVKAIKKKYAQRSEVKLKMREYAQRSEVKIRKKEYRQTLYKTNKEEELKNNQKRYQLNKERIRQYAQRPEVKARRREYDKKRYQLIKEKERELQFDLVFSSKQNFELSSFNYNNVYDEQVIKDALNNLELDQLNLLDKSIEQLLVGKKIAEQNIHWNNSIVVTSNLDSDIYDYNLSVGLIP